MNEHDFKDKFQTFLEKSGVEFLELTNPYELFRFRCKEGVGVVYEGKRGITCTGAADTALEFFRNKRDWIASKKYQRFERPETRNFLLERDGTKCFFCNKEMGEDVTIEHLLPRKSGGNDNYANLVLAHQKCNLAVGSISLKEKFLFFHNSRNSMTQEMEKFNEQ